LFIYKRPYLHRYQSTHVWSVHILKAPVGKRKQSPEVYTESPNIQHIQSIYCTQQFPLSLSLMHFVRMQRDSQQPHYTSNKIDTHSHVRICTHFIIYRHLYSFKEPGLFLFLCSTSSFPVTRWEWSWNTMKDWIGSVTVVADQVEH